MVGIIVISKVASLLRNFCIVFFFEGVSVGDNAFLYKFSCSRELGGGTRCLDILLGCIGCGLEVTRHMLGNWCVGRDFAPPCIIAICLTRPW